MCRAYAGTASPTKSYLYYKDIMGGGTLEFTMGPNPSKFGTAKKDRP